MDATCPGCGSPDVEPLSDGGLFCRREGRRYTATGRPVEAPPAPAPPAPRTTNLLAALALMSAVLWVFGLGSVVAIVLGLRARQEARLTGERGETMALVAIVIAVIGLLLALVSLSSGAVVVAGSG